MIKLENVSKVYKGDVVALHDASVEVRSRGTSATGASGRLSAIRARRPSQVSVTPPASAAARLSAWLSSSSPAARSSSGSPSGRAAASPSAMAAADEPRPRSSGMRLVNRKRRPAGSESRANARTARFVPSAGSSPAPSPSTTTPSPSVTSSSFQRPSATAAQSNAGPRLAEVAGARTITTRPCRHSRTARPPRSRRGRAPPRWAAARSALPHPDP